PPHPRRGGHRLRGRAAGGPGHRLHGVGDGRAVPVRRGPRRGGPARPAAPHGDPGRAMTPLRPYAQLVRLPALPTALADICLGALATRALPSRGLAFGLLLLASGCLYCGGMVWNDFFDLEQDRRERPFRPLPSGRVTPAAAARLGAALLAGGVLCALPAGWVLKAQGYAPA